MAPTSAAATSLFTRCSPARFPFPTRFVQELAYGKDLKGGAVPGIAQVPGIIVFAGGLPLMTAEKMHVGGIGVSGGTADQDEERARRALTPLRMR